MAKRLNIKKILLIILCVIIIASLIKCIYSLFSSNKPTNVIQPAIISQPIPGVQSLNNQSLNNQSLNNQSQAINQSLNNQSRAPYKLYNFYSPNCAYSNQFKSTWDNLSETLQDLSANISTHNIDVSKSENENLAFYYNVEKIPTILLITPNQTIEYTGNRTREDLIRFLADNTPIINIQRHLS